MDVFGEDADEYVCRAVNKAGVKSTRAELLIMSKYSFVFIVCVFFTYRFLEFISSLQHYLCPV